MSAARILQTPLVIALLSLSGCAGAEIAGYGDAGSVRVLDAAPSADAGPSSADSGLEPSPGPEFSGDRATDVEVATQACFNGMDDDGNGLGDCADPSCRENVRACCVAAGDPTCCEEPSGQEVDLEACASSIDLRACLLTEGLSLFGSPSPRLENYEGEGLSFLPGGQAGDSGALLDVVDPRVEAIELSTTIDWNRLLEGEANRLGLGWVDPNSLDTSGNMFGVVPILGFMVNVQLNEIALIIAGEVSQRWPLDPLTRDLGSVTLTLSRWPSGQMVFLREDAGIREELATLDLDLNRRLAGVVYGRSPNTSSTTGHPARATLLRQGSGACDMPQSIERSADPLLPSAALSQPVADGALRVGEPTFGELEGEGRLVVSIDRALWLARGVSGTFSLEDSALLSELTQPWAAEGLGHPTLFDGGQGLYLYFTAYGEGRSSIARVPVRTGWVVDEAEAERVLEHESDSFGGSTLYRVRGQTFLVVQALRAGVSSLENYELSASGRASNPLSTLREVSTGKLMAFDRDEVASPEALVLDDGVVRLYYAGRRGSRWGIGLLVSHDGRLFTEALSGPLLTGSGTGFDALGVRDPSALLSGGRLRLYYGGFDGVRIRLGVSEMALPALLPRP